MPTPRKTTYLVVVNMAIEEQLGPHGGGAPRPTPRVQVRASGPRIEIALLGDPRPRYGAVTVVTESATGRYARRNRTLHFRPAGTGVTSTVPLPNGPYAVHVDWEPAVQGVRVIRDLDRAPAL